MKFLPSHSLQEKRTKVGRSFNPFLFCPISYASNTIAEVEKLKKLCAAYNSHPRFDKLEIKFPHICSLSVQSLHFSQASGLQANLTKRVVLVLIQSNSFSLILVMQVITLKKKTVVQKVCFILST